MRKLLFLFVGITLILTQSCQKFNLSKDILEKRSIAASIKANETYTFTLPVNAKDAADVSITTQASHFKVSEIVTNANGNLVYQYTPEQDYTGTDAVVITGKGSARLGGGCHGDSLGMPHDSLHIDSLGNHPHHGHHGHHGKPKGNVTHELTINLTIDPASIKKTVEISTK